LQAGATEIVFVTDGLVSELGLLIDAVQLSTVRIHGVGVGLNPYRAALRRLADLTGGSSHFLSPSDDPANMVAALAAACLRTKPKAVLPVFQSGGGTPLAVQRFVPSSIRSNLGGNPLTATALFDAEAGAGKYLAGQIVLSGYSFVVAHANVTLFNGSAIHRSAAMRAIRNLEAEEKILWARFGATSSSTGAGKVLRTQMQITIQSVKKDIIALGLRYSLVSSHTSFLIIDGTFDANPATTPKPSGVALGKPEMSDLASVRTGTTGSSAGASAFVMSASATSTSACERSLPHAQCCLLSCLLVRALLALTVSIAS